MIKLCKTKLNDNYNIKIWKGCILQIFNVPIIKIKINFNHSEILCNLILDLFNPKIFVIKDIKSRRGLKDQN